MLTTIEQINTELQAMHDSLGRTLATGNVDELYHYNISVAKLQLAIYGNPWRSEIKPTFIGHLHVKKEFEFLLPCIK